VDAEFAGSDSAFCQEIVRRRRRSAGMKVKSQRKKMKSAAAIVTQTSKADDCDFLQQKIGTGNKKVHNTTHIQHMKKIEASEFTACLLLFCCQISERGA
jgi:hypothetical protein